MLLAVTFSAGAIAGVLAVRRHLLHFAAEPPDPSGLPARVTLPDEHLGKLSLFILAGQSNMSGRGPMPIPPPAAVPSVYVYANDGRFREAREPVDFAEGQTDEVSADPGAGFGPSAAFAEALRARRGDLPIGLVPCARGGSKIREWAPSRSPSTLYGSCFARALAASSQGRIAGVLFFQGEADAADPKIAPEVPPSPDTWARELSTLVAALRRDLGNPTLPVVFAELGKEPTEGGLFVAWERVKAEQRAVSLPGVARIRTDDLATFDGVHFTTESYRVIGGRFAEAMDSLLPP